MIISVASGKGGTGKTLVATNLAFAIMDSERSQLLDCDVEEPNDYIFTKPEIVSSEAVCLTVPTVDFGKCTYCGRCAEVCNFNAIAALPDTVLVFPNLCHGCGACGYLCPEKAITEEDREIGVVEKGRAGQLSFIQGKLTVGEAMAVPVIRKVKDEADNRSHIIIDSPPGTSCPVIESVGGSDFCLLVTEPTPFGLNDLVLAVETVRKLGIPCGVVINRDGSGNSGVEDYCLNEGIPVLMKIPLDRKIARLYSEGTILSSAEPRWGMRFKHLFENIRGTVNERDSST